MKAKKLHFAFVGEFAGFACAFFIGETVLLPDVLQSDDIWLESLPSVDVFEYIDPCVLTVLRENGLQIVRRSGSPTADVSDAAVRGAESTRFV